MAEGTSHENKRRVRLTSLRRMTGSAPQSSSNTCSWVLNTDELDIVTDPVAEEEEEKEEGVAFAEESDDDGGETAELAATVLVVVVTVAGVGDSSFGANGKCVITSSNNLRCVRTSLSCNAARTAETAMLWSAGRYCGNKWGCLGTVT